MKKAKGRTTGLVLLCAVAAIAAGCEGVTAPEADGGTQTEAQSSEPAPAFNGMAAVTPVNDDPDQLLGMTPDSVDTLLGAPALVRRDGDAEVWQYRSDICVLDLFFYGSVKQVEHVDLRDRGDGSPVAVRACFARMLTEAALTS